MFWNGRRTLVKGLLSYPFVLSLPRIGAADQNGVSRDDYEERYRAVRALRLLNTAQLRHKTANGCYADISLLKDSDAMGRVVASKTALGMGIGKSLYDSLKFGQKEILPGWSFNFAIAEDALGYVARLQNTSVQGGFSTDEVGVIYEGLPMDTDTIPSTVDAQDVITGSDAIHSHANPTSTRLAAFVRTIAMGTPAPQQCCFCRDYTCCCGLACSCQSTPVGDCNDCGCGSCIWCCSIY